MVVLILLEMLSENKKQFSTDKLKRPMYSYPLLYPKFFNFELLMSEKIL